MKQEIMTGLEETLHSFEKGYYHLGNQKIPIQLNRHDREKAICYLPPHIPKIPKTANKMQRNTSCFIHVENVDTLEAALKMKSLRLPPIVLNFANPFTPGGGVRRGAKAQEETLCLRSSLLESLESSQGLQYYNYNRDNKTFAASDAILITPYVEVIKDTNFQFLQESRIVSVITCAAPLVSPFSHRLEDYSAEDMESLLYQRIQGIVATIITHGYTHVVFGAWGCGAFCNDPSIIAKLFRRVLDEVNADNYFDEICFAILSKFDSTNYDKFKEYFR